MSEIHDSGLHRAKKRSPNYPGISLDMAIQRAGELYAKERQHPAPVLTVAQHWNYKSFNGPASVSLAALKKFGLLEDVGSGDARAARVSDVAVEIIASPHQQQRQAAIRDAALRPEIHREMWERYGPQLPSDATLQWELTRSRGFTETGASEFIREYKATLAFARLEEAGYEGQVQVADDDNARANAREEPAERGQRVELRHLSPDSRRAFPIPLVGGGTVVVDGEFPLSEHDWAQFMAVLGAMKPGLVASDAPDRISEVDRP